MSTNHVKKGANRAAHAAKTAKHAQRTDLPGQKVSYDPAVEAGVDAAYEAAFARAAARRSASAPADDEAPSDAPALPVKAQDVVTVGRAAGWEVDVVSQGDVHEVVATRDGESIKVTFVGNGWSVAHRQVFVRRDGSEVKFRNASAVKKHMTAERAIPSERSVRAARPMQVDNEASEERGQRSLPFDPFTISDADLLTLLSKGARITWQNSARQRETALCLPGVKSLRLHPTPNGPAKRAITFVSMPDGQWRSLSLAGMLRCEPLSADEADEARAEYRRAFAR